MLWVVLGLLVIALIVVFVFGDSPSFRGTAVQAARSLILRWNNLILDKVAAIEHPFFKWLVPVFYVGVISFCFEQFFTKTWKILPSSVRSSGLHQFLVSITISLVYISTTICIFSNPGYIHKYNVNTVNRAFHNNEIIFFDNNHCSTCKFQKPARSKHCSTCDRCVMLFDHHCVWINNCVGYYNYRYFILWLVTNINFMIYGLYLMLQAIPITQIWLYIKIDEYYKVTGMFIILCCIFSVVVIVFTGLQIRYIYLGVTTNEVDKWGDIEYLVRIGTLYKRDGQYLELVRDKFINMQDTALYPFDDEAYKIESVEEIDNIYDRGFNNNFTEKMFPVNYS